MVTPVSGPGNPPPDEHKVKPKAPDASAQTPRGSAIDPTGAWQSFLSTPGTQATPEQVTMFLNTMLKMFNVLIQQQNAAHKRAQEVLRKAEKGEQ